MAYFALLFSAPSRTVQHSKLPVEACPGTNLSSSRFALDPDASRTSLCLLLTVSASRVIRERPMTLLPPSEPSEEGV